MAYLGHLAGIGVAAIWLNGILAQCNRRKSAGLA